MAVVIDATPSFQIGFKNFCQRACQSCVYTANQLCKTVMCSVLNVMTYLYGVFLLFLFLLQPIVVIQFNDIFPKRTLAVGVLQLLHKTYI